jgi:predicted neuraminidase
MAEPTAIPNPNSSADVAQFENGRLALTYNPHRNRFGGRATIAVSMSDGHGEKWTQPSIVERKENGSYSYPFSFSYGDRLRAVYSWNRLSVAFFELKIEERNKP